MKGDWNQCIAYADYVLGNSPGVTLRPWISYQEQLEGRQGATARDLLLSPDSG